MQLQARLPARVIFNITTNSLQLYNGTGWVSLTTPSITAVFLPTIVNFGTQQWMNKNLDAASHRNGDPIPPGYRPYSMGRFICTGAWCYYNNDSTQG
jgi:hypothetical protein